MEDFKMPFGKHIGLKLKEVPADYLLWCYEKVELHGELKAYIEDNLDTIRKKAKELNDAYQASKKNKGR